MSGRWTVEVAVENGAPSSCGLLDMYGGEVGVLGWTGGFVFSAVLAR
jgi:hypothetical protein